jgi:hypothetical protein
VKNKNIFRLFAIISIIASAGFRLDALHNEGRERTMAYEMNPMRSFETICRDYSEQREEQIAFRVIYDAEAQNACRLLQQEHAGSLRG